MDKTHNRGAKINNIVIIIILCYIITTFIQFEFNKDQRIINIGLHLPRVNFGDEPHYLVATNSFIKDLDLNIKNNYDDAEFKNSFDVGHKFKGTKLERRDFYLFNKKDFNNIIRDKNNKYELFPEYQTINLSQFYFLTQVPPGLPIFAGIILYFLNEILIEAGAIILSIIIALVGLYYLYKMLCYFSKDKRISLFFTFIFAFGTPLWFYSKTFLADIYITSILIIGLYYFLKNNFVLSGFILGVGILFKYNFVVLILPFLIYLLITNYKSLVKFTIGLLPSVLFEFTYNYYFFGSILNTGRVLPYNNFFEGLVGIIFSYQNGLLFFMPFMIFSILGMKRFYKKYKKESILIYSIILIQYLFTSIIFWWGGAGYSNRYMLPVILLFSLPMLFWYKHNRSSTLKKIFHILIFISILINFQAALFSALFLNKPPWELLSILITKSHRLIEILLI